MEPFHDSLEKSVSTISHDMCPFDSHQEASILRSKHVDLSKVRVLKGLDELEGICALHCGVTHLNDAVRML